jgi:chitodextrinase
MRSCRVLLLFFVTSLAWSTSPQAQFDTSVLSAARRIDWSEAGVPGGIPNRTNTCATFSPGATAAQINAAIASCVNGVVQLGAGTYNLSAGITFRGRDNVTLRGLGPDRTILRFSASDACGGVDADVCIEGAAVGSSPPSSNIHNWIGGYAKDSTQITVDSASGITVGSVLVLDQLDDPSDTGGVYISCSSSASLETCPPTRSGRSQQEMVQVVSVSGAQVTVSPAIHMPNWRSARQPQVWWWGESGEMNGVEDMTLDHTNSTETAGIGFRNAYRSWVKNVKSLNSNRNHVWLYRSAKIEVRNSYFYGTKNAATLSYGVESFMVSNALVINNIFEHVSRPIMMGSAVGGVYAYNYMIDMYYTSPATWMNAGINGGHDSGTGMNLFEGNVGTGFLMDLYHGTGALPTLFRNRLTGQEPGKTQNTSVINIWAFYRQANIVGNVLGSSGYHTKYENSRVSPGTSGSPDRSIYLLGYSGVNEGTSLGYDPLVVTTMLRWGNFDYATQQTRWNSAEIPAGHPVPATHTLPASLFLSARPSWWGTMPWPAIGPDVTGGLDPAGHAHRIPAQVCFAALPRSTDGTLAFNPAQCYPVGPPDTTDPSVPSGVSATAATYSQVTLTWTAATDNVGVTGYRIFRCQGTGCTPTALVATTGTTSYADTELLANTRYGYAVAAVDASGNVSALSTAASAVTPALPLPSLDLIAVYGFNEATGTTAADASPYRNTGTLSGATWTAGRWGNAVALNGTSLVEAADIVQLTPQTNATFHAWVRLTTAPTEVASVFNKWSQTTEDEYLVGINPNRTLYFAWQTTGGSSWGTPSYHQASGVSPIPLNTFTHIAVVRSGTALRFYINGVLDTALTNAIDNSPFRDGTMTLRMGGQARGVRDRFLHGSVDEAFIYKRALTIEEIRNNLTIGAPRPPGAATTVRVLR